VAMSPMVQDLSFGPRGRKLLSETRLDLAAKD
jgi:hypothetical protein